MKILNPNFSKVIYEKRYTIKNYCNNNCQSNNTCCPLKRQTYLKKPTVFGFAELCMIFKWTPGIKVLRLFKSSILFRNIVTSCLSTLSESTPKSSPVKICSAKSLPGEKGLDFLPPRQYCIIYFTMGKIPHHRWSPVNFWISPNDFCDITDTPWCVATSHWNHKNAR